jgi:hypothetical protein
MSDYKSEQPGYQTGYQQQPNFVIGAPGVVIYPPMFGKHPQNINWLDLVQDQKYCLFP